MSRARKGYWAVVWGERVADGWAWWVKMNYDHFCVKKIQSSSPTSALRTALVWTRS